MSGLPFPTQQPASCLPAVIIVMGVAGCGKSSVGVALAEALGFAFADADQFHSLANKQKMGSGVPLSDEDRQPWLEAMATAVGSWIDNARPHVLACSALKAGYRKLLAAGHPDVRFVYLRADRQLVAARLAARSGHYMKNDMVDSQLAALEEPAAGQALIVDAAEPLAAIVQSLLRQLAPGR